MPYAREVGALTLVRRLGVVGGAGVMVSKTGGNRNVKRPAERPQPPPPRPRMPRKTRGQQLNVRFREEEIEEMKLAAYRSPRLNLSDWVRWVLLKAARGGRDDDISP